MTGGWTTFALFRIIRMSTVNWNELCLKYHQEMQKTVEKKKVLLERGQPFHEMSRTFTESNLMKLEIQSRVFWHFTKGHFKKNIFQNVTTSIRDDLTLEICLLFHHFFYPKDQEQFEKLSVKLLIITGLMHFILWLYVSYQHKFVYIHIES